MCKSLTNTAINLKVVRESLGVSTKEFAELAGRCTQQVKLWEEGVCSPNAETMFHLVINIEAEFGVHIDLNEVITGTIPYFHTKAA